jgi:hypothetical protein
MIRSITRAGAVLIIVVGLAAMLVSLAVAYLARARADAAETSAILADAQARVMLHAALMYIQEGSRIGWSTRALEVSGGGGGGWREEATFDSLGQRRVTSLGNGVTNFGGEAYGWTDVRNGWIGPIGPRVIANGASGDGYIPNPTWWSGYQPFPEDGQLGSSVWPMPGSVLRIASEVAEVPPYAVSLNTTPNPFFPIVNTWGTPAWETTWNSTWHTDTNTTIWGPIWGNPQMIGLLHPQPVMDRWSGGTEDFQTGKLSGGTLSVIERTRNRSWFRIYRERLADHDGDGTPYFDQMKISERVGGSHVNKNWSVFLITVGAGATQGFRDWSEVTSSGASALFGGDQAFFEELRRTEAIQWWRAEWSAVTGGFDANLYEGNWYGGNLNESQRRSMVKSHRWATWRSFGGNFKWLQRLDPPADWIRNGTW